MTLKKSLDDITDQSVTLKTSLDDITDQSVTLKKSVDETKILSFHELTVFSWDSPKFFVFNFNDGSSMAGGFIPIRWSADCITTS